MLRNLNQLDGYAVSASDGAFGHVKDFYFDDQAWTIQYLVVETGGLLSRRRLLISATALGKPDDARKRIALSVTIEHAMASPEVDAARAVKAPHLRSGRAVSGHPLHALDGDIGHLAGLLVDDDTWAILYLIVSTGHWWAGHHVLVAPEWIQQARWSDAAVSVNVTRQAIQDAPPYDPARPLDRQQEMALYRHYGRPGYWAGAEIVATDIMRI